MGTLIRVVVENVDHALAEYAPDALQHLAQPAAKDTGSRRQ